MFYLAAALILFWLIVTLYVVFMGQRQRGLAEEIAVLEDLLAAQNKGQ